MLGGSYHAQAATGRGTCARGMSKIGLSTRLRGPNLSLQLALATTVAAAWLHHAKVSSLASTNIANSTTSNATSTSQRTHSHINIVTLHSNGTLNQRNRHNSTRRGQIRSFATVSESRSNDESKDQLPFDPKHTDSSKDSVALSDTEDINELMRHPALLNHIKAPRNPIILCHGLYGFDVRGPFWGLEIHYWATVLDILRKKVGADVIVRGVPGTGAIADRAEALHKYLCSEEAGIKGKQVNFIGHSMGGLDARYLISVLKPAPEEYTPISLTSLSTPHRGSPFMDWCNANVGTGNDRVEAEIREAKQRQQQTGSSTNTKSAQQEEEEEDFQKHEISKPPFSLKTPLFVRPSAKGKGTEVNEGKTEQKDFAIGELLKPVISGVTASLVQQATSPSSSESSTGQAIKDGAKELKQEAKSDTDQKESGKKKKNGKDSPLIDFSLFNRALSSIGGSFSSYMLSVLDQPAYAMLSTRYMAQVFNPTVPNSPNVSYFSVASRKRSLPIYHPLWLPKLILDAAAESRTAGGERDGSADALGSKSQGNDGLVSVESAKWGKFLGIIDGCDHWDLRGGGAPRWKGKVNPQTGKPLVIDESKEKQKVESANEEKNKKEKGNTWNDINSIVRNLISSKDKETGKEAGKEGEKMSKKEKPEEKDEKDSSTLKDVIASVVPSKSSKNDHDQGLVDEVANWISDRLPEGNEERRAEAERAADEYAKENSSFGKKEEEIEIGQQDKEREVGKEEKFQDPKNDTTTDFNDIKLSVKLRREAAWQEELGHSETARELRRELAWHRAEWDRALASGKAPASVAERLQRNSQSYPASRELDWDAHAKNRSMYNTNNSSTNQKPVQVTSADELERFWIALCRHLWAHGF